MIRALTKELTCFAAGRVVADARLSNRCPSAVSAQAKKGMYKAKTVDWWLHKTHASSLLHATGEILKVKVRLHSCICRARVA